MKRSASLFAQVIAFCLLVAAAGGLWLSRDYVSEVWASMSSQETKSRKFDARRHEAVNVVVQRVETASDDTVIEAVGTGRAHRSVTLYPEADGEILSLRVRAGDQVDQGDIILRLDTEDAELAMQIVKTRLLEAERQAQRVRKLKESSVISSASVDDAETTLERTKIELLQAAEDLSKRTLHAPFSGIAGIPKVERGDRVNTSSAIVTLDDRTELLVEFTVPEIYMSQIRADQAIEARTPSMADRKFSGTIDQIDSRVDPDTRSVAVRAVLPNVDDLLRPGMSFAVQIALAGKSYPLIPELALIWAKGKSHVWLVRDEKAKQVGVTIVRRLNSTILVDGDIREGDLVVVEGVQRLRDGAPVKFSSPEQVSLLGEAPDAAG